MNTNMLTMKDIEAGMILTIDGYVSLSPYGGVLFAGCELPGYITLGPHTVVFTVPETFSNKSAEIEAINEEIMKTQLKHKVELDALINQRTALLSTLEPSKE